MVIRPLELCLFNVQKLLVYEKCWVMHRRVEKTADAKLKLCVCVCTCVCVCARARCCVPRECGGILFICRQ